MTLQDLEYFRVTCTEKSITKAARLLYITPQGLSKTIKNLEKDFNTTLLNRNTSGVTLTTSGQYLYDQLPDFLGHYQSIRKNIEELTQKENHEIDMISAYGILRLVTPECIISFKKEHPEIKVNYREYPDLEVERRFINHQGNVAFSVGPSDFIGLNKQKLESFDISLVVHKSHPLAKKEKVSFSDIKDEPFYLVNSDFQVHHLFLDRCKALNFTPNIVFTSSGFSLCYRLVDQNKGVTLTTDFFHEDMKTENTVKIPFDENFYWTPYLLLRKGVEPGPDIQLFTEHVVKWIQDTRDGSIKR